MAYSLPPKLIRTTPTLAAESIDPGVLHMAVGVAAALHALMLHHATPGAIPRSLDETRCVAE